MYLSKITKTFYLGHSLSAISVYQPKARMQLPINYYLGLITYILSHTVSELSWSIGQIIAFEMGCISGAFVQRGLQNSASKKHKYHYIV